MSDFFKSLLGAVVWLSIPAYLTSLIYCITREEWLAAIFMHGILVPVGIVHGWFVWFGASWF